MKAPNQIFADACLTWGIGPPVQQTTRDLPLFRGFRTVAHGWINSVRSLSTVKDLGNIHVDFIDNLSLNATADIRDRLGLIGVTAGAVFLVVDFFFRLLSHPQTLPKIGKPSEESVGPLHNEPLSRNFLDPMASRLMDGRPLFASPPKNSTRSAFASTVSKIAADFLVGHELTHLANGHVSYLYASCGLPYIIELQPHSKPAVHDPLTRQTLEMDADAGAVALSLGFVDTIRKSGPWHPELAPFLSTPEEALYAWGYAISGLFYIWGLSADLSRITDTYHPPTGVRFNMCLADADRQITQRTPEFEGKVKSCALQGFFDLINDVKMIGRAMEDEQLVATFELAIQQPVRDYVHSLLAHWHVIRPELLKYSCNQNLDNTPP